MRSYGPRLLVSLALLTLALPAIARGQSPPQAQPPEDAKKLYDDALSLYALGHYAEAAPLFERVFELKHVPAILYNAAQAHRLAGHLTHALTLYESYLRLYGDPMRKAEIEARIDELERMIEAQKQGVPPPATSAATDAPPALARSAGVTDEPTIVLTLPPPHKPWWKRPWVWGVIGGAVVVAVGVGVGVGVGARPSAPQPSYGAVRF